MVLQCSLSDRKSPEVSRTLLRILAVFNNAVVWMVSTRPPTYRSSSPFSNPLVIVPKAPITIGIIVTFMFHSYFSSLARLWYDKFPDFFVQEFRNVVDAWKFSMLLLYILWYDWPIFYDFTFKRTATAAIGIHPTKAWLSQLVNFKNAIWTWRHFRRTICNKLLF